MPPVNISNIQEVSKAGFSELIRISPSEYFQIIKPLLFFIIGITIYSLFIFKFYKFIARRDIIQLDLDKFIDAYDGFVNRIFKVLFYFLENLILVPIFIFFWFIVIATILLLLSKYSSPNQILVISVSLVAAIRVTAYYNEQLSQDIAKMIPFVLLGIFLVDASFFSLQETIDLAFQLPSIWKISVYYLIFVIILEFILSIIYHITNRPEIDSS